MEKKFREELNKSKILAAPGRFSSVLVLDHLKPDFNVGKIFRSAQAFGVKEILLINIPFFDPYPAKGALKRVSCRFFEKRDECFSYLKEEGYTVISMNAQAPKIISDLKLPEKSAFLLCNEGYGLNHRDQDGVTTKQYVEKSGLSNIETSIPMHGEVESLNVSIAASISLYEYNRQQLSV